jgi:phosphoglycolate phosphatase-like HAD superfamily hydrolase
MVGDSTWDAEAAVKAGCGFVGVAATEAGVSRFGSDVQAAPDLVAALGLCATS